MKYIESPNQYEGTGPSLFMAGGISGCPDWQSRYKELLEDLDLTVFNPRRANMILNPELLEEQILWEHDKLQRSTAISFWFPAETLCPITLYELGKWTVKPKKLFIGTHPDYQRRRDVVFQTLLERPDIEVTNSVEALALQVHQWVGR